MAATQTTGPSEREIWFRGHVMTRFFATVWWVVMVFITVNVAATLIALALDPHLARLIGLGIGVLIFIPVWREWPSWRRMARMLRHGT